MGDHHPGMVFVTGARVCGIGNGVAVFVLMGDRGGIRAGGAIPGHGKALRGTRCRDRRDKGKSGP